MEHNNIKVESTVRSLLVVDDDENTQILISEAMEGSGINVIKSFCGEEALNDIEKYANEIFLILLDIFLPDCNGWTLLENIRNRNLKTPVIVISAVPFSMQCRASQNTKFCNYIVKPFEIDNLKRIILSYIKPPVDDYDHKSKIIKKEKT
jgi:DNA-binding NtrC family response regulator